MRRSPTPSLLGLLALAAAACGGADGEPGPAGAKGDKGDVGPAPTTPSFNLVFPNKGVVGRELDVVVNAQGIAGQVNVDFGDPAVVVSNPRPAGDGTVIVHLAIDAKAKPGPRDVSVSAGGVTAAGKAAFTVASGMDVSVVEGTPEQGGIFRVKLVNNDDANAFDTGTTGDGFFTPLTPNLAVQGTGIVDLSTDFVSVNEARLTFLAEPVASGNAAIVAANAPGGKPILTFSAPADAVKIAARAPTALTLGAAKAGETLAKALDTKLYKINVPAQPGIVAIDLTGKGAKLTPSVYVLGAKGTFADLFTGGAADAPLTTQTLTFPVTATQNAGDYWMIVLDGALKGGAAADYAFDVKPSVTSVAAGSVIDEQAGAHATPAAAQTIASGALPLIVKGKVGVADEIDVYKINLAANAKVELTFAPGLDGQADFDSATDFSTAVSPSLAGKTGRVVLVNGAAAKDHYVRIQGDGFGAKQTGDYLFSLRVLP